VSARTAKIAVTKHKREQSRDARIANVEIRATTVTLCPPYRYDRTLPPITVNVFLVEEPNPPAGCEPIQWLLVTTLPIGKPSAQNPDLSFFQITTLCGTVSDTGEKVADRLDEGLSPMEAF
jgi:hypothetical protein